MTPNESVETYQCVKCEEHFPAEDVRFVGVHTWTQAMVHIGDEMFMCGSCLFELANEWLNEHHDLSF